MSGIALRICAHPFRNGTGGHAVMGVELIPSLLQQPAESVYLLRSPRTKLLQALAGTTSSAAWHSCDVPAEPAGQSARG
jgi:hypothetical protein